MVSGRNSASANELGTKRKSARVTAGKYGERKTLFSSGKNGLPKCCSRRRAHGPATTAKLAASATKKPREHNVFPRRLAGRKSNRTHADRACNELVSFSALAAPNSKPAHTIRAAPGTRR